MATIETALRRTRTLGTGVLRRNVALGLLLALLLFLTAYPLGMLVYGSLHTTPPGAEGTFNLDGYRAMASRTNAIVLLNTIVLSLVKTVLAMMVALFLAWIIARTDTPGRAMLEVLITLPFYIPPILTAMAWGMLATPKGGLINLAWTWMTGSRDPLVNIYSYGGVVWHMMQYSTPFLFLLMVGAFKSMDPALEESSRTSGATATTTFRRVTLGLMLPVTTSAFILSFIRGVESFESALIFGTPAGIEVITTEIYHLIHHTNRPDYQQATALALGIMVLMFGLVAWQWQLLGGRSFFTVTGKGYTPQVTRLGRWRWATFSFCMLFFVITVVLPVGQLVISSFFKFFGFYRTSMLTLDHYSAAWSNRLLWRALGNTLLLGVLGATATMMLGGVVAYVLVRTRFRIRRVLEILAWLPWMMPGMVLGVGFLWAYALMPGPIQLYGTLWALLVAYVTLGTPLAVRTMTGAFAQLAHDLEECSRVHGAAWWTTFRRILLALAWPAFAVGWILIFFIILRELSASILLYSVGNEVLSVVVMRLWTEGKAGQVSVIALVMLALIFVFRFVESRLVRSHISTHN
ncbi:MAG TPA: iron ABC transporter permease [Methylomirabilota bacterium]|jgi:iron(III) transport system permease protein|nr:iron ABC transporter permease [Methylomirabilota bacterium]